MTLTRKAIQVGNSLGMTLPPEFIKGGKVKTGDELETNVHGDTMYVRTKKSYSPKLTPEFKQWLDDFGRKYKSTIIELANLP